MFVRRASHSLPGEHDLVDSPHSLRCQSECDLLGRNHVDGWGVAYYRNRQPLVLRGIEPAYQDPRYRDACVAARSTTVMAHVRRASKGILKLENCHPFTRGKWVFAHNGTLTALEALRARLYRETKAASRRLIRGDTDSELIFHWLLDSLEKQKAIAGDRCLSLPRMRQSIAMALADLDSRNAKAEQGSTKADPAARLNVFLTNGSVLIAARMRNSLHTLTRKTRLKNGTIAHSVTFASEPFGPGNWREIDDLSVVSLSSEFTLASDPIIVANP